MTTRSGSTSLVQGPVSQQPAKVRLVQIKPIAKFLNTTYLNRLCARESSMDLKRYLASISRAKALASEISRFRKRLGSKWDLNPGRTECIFLTRFLSDTRWQRGNSLFCFVLKSPSPHR